MEDEEFNKGGGDMQHFEGFRNALKEKYNFADWAGMAREAQGALSRKFISRPEEMDDFVFETRRAIPEAGNSYVKHYRNLSDESVTIAVTVVEYSSILDAHEGMIDHLSKNMVPSLPRAVERGINVGDVGFAGHGDMQTSVFFTRNNLFVKVHSVGRTDVPVKDFAERIDQQIREHLNS